MRVCHVITKPELGGAQLSTLNLLTNLPKDIYDISIITSPQGILKPEFQGIKGVNSYFPFFLTRSINPIVDILAFIHIYFIYRCNKYKIVHTHSSKAGFIGRLAARLAGIPVILHTVHGWPFNDYQNFFIKRLFIFLERLTACFTTRIICVSNHDIETGLRYKIASKEKFVLIKYGIPLCQFKTTINNREEKRKELGINNNDPIVGMVSCLKPQKSPLDYVKASIDIYKEMPRINFLLIGDGILKARCKKALSNSTLNGRFIFSGWRRDIPEILDIIDILLLTSKWEGMPIAIIEVLCKGKQVIITDVGGNRELVRDGITGYLTKPGDYRETSQKALNILKDRDSFIKMAEEAKKSIDDSFDIKYMVNNIDRLYRALA